jgi:DNA-directed RNA polymerase specialized sigma24 family protein
VRPMTLEQLEAFYTIEYPKLVKILVLLDATVQEAEDAAQKAMAEFAERSRTEKAPDHPTAYVQRAAINFFIKERQRGRERLPRELQGGHLVLEAHLDDRLTRQL